MIKDNEILIFKEKFFEDKGILNVISYYQENDSKFYRKQVEVHSKVRYKNKNIVLKAIIELLSSILKED